jgi:hypothetical protein
MTAEAHSATAQRDPPRSPTPVAAPVDLPERELNWSSLTW